MVLFLCVINLCRPAAVLTLTHAASRFCYRTGATTDSHHHRLTAIRWHAPRPSPGNAPPLTLSTPENRPRDVGTFQRAAHPDARPGKCRVHHRPRIIALAVGRHWALERTARRRPDRCGHVACAPQRPAASDVLSAEVPSQYLVHVENNHAVSALLQFQREARRPIQSRKFADPRISSADPVYSSRLRTRQVSLRDAAYAWFLCPGRLSPTQATITGIAACIYGRMRHGGMTRPRYVCPDGVGVTDVLITLRRQPERSVSVCTGRRPLAGPADAALLMSKPRGRTLCRCKRCWRSL
jgi:hypothetical protein